MEDERLSQQMDLVWFLPKNDKIVITKKLGQNQEQEQKRDKTRIKAWGERRKAGLCFEVMGAETKLGETRGNKKG